MSYLFLFLAIISEVIGTILLKMTNGFSVFMPAVGTVIFYVLSFYLMSISLKTIEVGIAYAIWSAVGMSLIAILGIVFFNETISWLKFVSVGLIILGVIGLCFVEAKV